MALLGYKKQFAPFVKDGSKTHTIRKRRKHPPKPGSMLYHYEGLRTVSCTKLCETPFKKLQTICINSKGVVYTFSRRLTDEEVKVLSDPYFGALVFDFIINGESTHYLSPVEKDQLAWRDGFRPDGTSLDAPAGAFKMMFKFFKQTHGLPFVGDFIHW